MNRLEELTKLLKDYEEKKAAYDALKRPDFTDEWFVIAQKSDKAHETLHDFIFTGSITSEDLDKFVVNIEGTMKDETTDMA